MSEEGERMVGDREEERNRKNTTQSELSINNENIYNRSKVMKEERGEGQENKKGVKQTKNIINKPKTRKGKMLHTTYKKIREEVKTVYTKL